MRHVGIPVGIYLAFRCNMGLHGLWCGLTLSLIYISIVGLWIVLRTDWDQEVLNVQKRLEVDEAYQSMVNNSMGECV
jgi:multidrug resistance protein, MATE family